MLPWTGTPSQSQAKGNSNQRSTSAAASAAATGEPRVAVEHLADLAGQRPRRRAVEGALALLAGEIGQRSVVEGVGRAPGDLEGAVHEQATQRRQAVTALVLLHGRSPEGAAR